MKKNPPTYVYVLVYIRVRYWSSALHHMTTAHVSSDTVDSSYNKLQIPNDFVVYYKNLLYQMNFHLKHTMMTKSRSCIINI